MAGPISNPFAANATRWYSDPALWRKIQRVSLLAGRKVVTALLVLYHCMRDKDTPMWAKGVITGALGYFILPADLVPDLLPGAGYGDDWGAIVAAMATVAAYIKDEHKRLAATQVQNLLKSEKPSPTAELIE